MEISNKANNVHPEVNESQNNLDINNLEIKYLHKVRIGCVIAIYDFLFRGNS